MTNGKWPLAAAGMMSMLVGCTSTSMIPREVLFGNPDKAAVRLSPDGERISFLAPVDGVLNVWVGPADDPDQAQPITHDTKRGIRIYFWAYTNDHVLYLQDKDGDENWRVYSVDLADGQTRDLTPLEGVRAQMQEVSHRIPDEILIGLNDRDPRFHDIHRVNIRTGERTAVQENTQGFAGFLTDESYDVRFAMRMTPDGGQEVLEPSGEDDWAPFAKIEMEDTLTTGPVGFDATGRVMYMIDSRNRDTAALTALNLDTEESTVLAEDDQADISQIMIHPTRKHVEAAAATYARRQWQFLDESIEREFAMLRNVSDGEIEITSRTLDDEEWIVAYLQDDGPVRYYHYDRKQGKPRFLFTNRQSLENQPLVEMHSEVIPSRDGLNLVSYLSLPPRASWLGNARPTKRLPMVLLVHGGPWGRDGWGYDPMHQWLANRGYAVLSVNFRGSTGFGKSFINAGNKEWAAKMHDDLIDAVQWAIGEGIADPDRVAIMGGSYGGYATLVGLTFTPETFACGVDIVGPSNLVTLLSTIPPYWEPMVELFATRVGDNRTDEGKEFLRSRSPLTYAERIRRPLLIGQGANDPRVKQDESDQIVQAMQAKNIPVTYVLYPDEGHGFARPENRLSFNAITEAFLAEVLGGRYQPIGGDFEGSSLTVPVGAENVPGLDRALNPDATGS